MRGVPIRRGMLLNESLHVRLSFHEPVEVATFSKLEWISEAVTLANSRYSVWFRSNLVMLAMAA